MSAHLVGKEIDAVIFDVDGTLYSQEVLNKVFNDVRLILAANLLRYAGTPQPDPIEVDNMKAIYLREAEESGSFSQTYASMGGSVQEFKKLVEGIDRSAHLSSDLRLRQDILQLGKVVKVGLFTATLESTTHDTCSTLFGGDWRILFNTILCCDTPGVLVEKPNPAAFLHILDSLGVTPGRALMVGDVPGADLIPAAALGMLTVQVGRNDYSHADLHVSSVTDLFDHFKLSNKMQGQ